MKQSSLCTYIHFNNAALLLTYLITQFFLAMFAEDILKDYGSFMEKHDDKMQSLRKQMPNNILDNAGSQLLASLPSAIEINYVDSSCLKWHNMKLSEFDLLANKPLTTLANLCNHCNELTKTAQQLQLKFVNTNCQIENMQMTQGLDCTLYNMSAAIDFFCQIYFLLKRIIVVLQNIWTQITGYLSLASVDIHEAHIFVSAYVHNVNLYCTLYPVVRNWQEEYLSI